MPTEKAGSTALDLDADGFTGRFRRLDDGSLEVEVRFATFGYGIIRSNAVQEFCNTPGQLMDIVMHSARRAMDLAAEEAERTLATRRLDRSVGPAVKG